jgi:hypothetical protein
MFLCNVSTPKDSLSIYYTDNIGLFLNSVYSYIYLQREYGRTKVFFLKKHLSHITIFAQSMISLLLTIIEKYIGVSYVSNGSMLVQIRNYQGKKEYTINYCVNLPKPSLGRKPTG